MSVLKNEQIDEKNGAKETGKNKKSTPFKEFLSTLLYIVVVFFVFLAIRQFLFVPVSVDGASMEPTLQHKDRLILSKVGEIDRFDIVVFPAPDDPEKQYIKRVIGVPGDSIRYEEDTLFINDYPVDEPYIDFIENSISDSETYTSDFSLDSVTEMETVPDEHYFLMGDNRSNSKDSRVFGFIHEDDIIGQANLRIWPLEKFGFVNDVDADSVSNKNVHN